MDQRRAQPEIKRRTVPEMGDDELRELMGGRSLLQSELAQEVISLRIRLRRERGRLFKQLRRRVGVWRRVASLRDREADSFPVGLQREVLRAKASEARAIAHDTCVWLDALQKYPLEAGTKA